MKPTMPKARVDLYSNTRDKYGPSVPVAILYFPTLRAARAAVKWARLSDKEKRGKLTALFESIGFPLNAKRMTDAVLSLQGGAT